MAKQVIKNATIIYAYVDISAEAHEVSLGGEVDVLDVTNYAGNGWQECLGSMRRGEVSLMAFLNDTANPDKVIWDIQQAPFYIHPNAYPPVNGGLAFLIHGTRMQQNRKYQVGQVAAIDLKISNNSGPVLRGITLHHVDGLSGTVNGTAFNHGAVASNERVYADLMVRSISGLYPTLDVTVESDTVGFPTPTTRITFDQVTDVSAESTRYQSKSAAGPITDTYWRGTFTVGGTGVDIDLTLFLAIA